MSVRLEGDIIRLEGRCGVEEAETVAALFDQGGGWEVDLSACRHLHSALAQALLVFRPSIRNSAAEDVFIKDFLLPGLALALEDR